MPSDAAKKARMCETKYFSSGVSFSQSTASCCAARAEAARLARWRLRPGACAGRVVSGRASSARRAARRAARGGSWGCGCGRRGPGRRARCELAGPAAGGGRAHRQINLLRGPEAGLCLLVHLPHLRVLDREEHEPLLVRLQDGLLGVDRVLLVLWHICRRAGRGAASQSRGRERAARGRAGHTRAPSGGRVREVRRLRTCVGLAECWCGSEFPGQARSGSQGAAVLRASAAVVFSCSFQLQRSFLFSFLL